MSEPFIGEIRVYAFNFPPRGWAECLGQLLPINQNQALFSLLGTQFGGNGQINFALPNFGGRVAIGQSSRFFVGERGGEAIHTLSVAEIPEHHHAMRGSSSRANIANPTGGVFANPFMGTIGRSMYGNAANAVAAAGVIAQSGGSQAHNNMQPYLVMLPCIALQGIFPPRN